MRTKLSAISTRYLPAAFFALQWRRQPEGLSIKTERTPETLVHWDSSNRPKRTPGLEQLIIHANTVRIPSRSLIFTLHTRFHTTERFVTAPR
jgi:hypothetical protein